MVLAVYTVLILGAGVLIEPSVAADYFRTSALAAFALACLWTVRIGWIYRRQGTRYGRAAVWAMGISWMLPAGVVADQVIRKLGDPVSPWTIVLAVSCAFRYVWLWALSNDRAA